MAIIHNVGNNRVSDYGVDDKLYMKVFDNQTVDDNNLLSVVGAINKFNGYLIIQIDALKKLDENNIIKSFFSFSRKVKTEIKNIENTLANDSLKLAFNKYAISKLSRELSEVERFAKTKIGEKKAEAIDEFLSYLVDYTKQNYFDFDIIAENLIYYKNYLALLVGSLSADVENRAKADIYRASINGALEADNYQVCEKLINIDFIKSALTPEEADDISAKILLIKSRNILTALEVELGRDNDLSEIKSKISGLKKAKYINNIEANTLFKKITDNLKLTSLTSAQSYDKELTEKLLNIFTQIYNSTLEFDKLYTQVTDNNIYEFILKIVENSQKNCSESAISEREQVFKNIAEGVSKRYIQSTTALINIKDVYERLDIVCMIKILKLIAERRVNELNII